ncbi:hypothetical protein CKO_00244 [Citrobacter koseri ATCC BAA-895]|uniref:Uncharacterized protein n=1 Tax=Citrobacter koseri (strain ATCC BAA-895 / CDC 4225-83 / SGSC4696) TaxID=290338 RepID=A8AD45_CITK8|nr:hypothetical protein CKO_00244 [Citrobacter koseri ATCC BAA-895]
MQTCRLPHTNSSRSAKYWNHDDAATLGRKKIAGNATNAITQNKPFPKC